MMKLIKFFVLAAAALMLAGCTDRGQVMDGAGTMKSYIRISQEEAARMMEADDGHVVVDVRRKDEYVSGHIPGAILIPNESIGTEPPKELPDKNQVILIYCRSGNRSKQAAEKLFNMGYNNIYEFGGINTWKGEVVTGDYEEQVEIDNPDEEDADAMNPTAILVIEVNGKQFFPAFAGNSSAEAFLGKLNSGPLKIELHDYGNFEKVGPLPWELPVNDEEITTVPGDIILYQGNQISIYYDENTWNFTRLAQIDSVTKEELMEALGDGDVTVEFHLEWSE